MELYKCNTIVARKYADIDNRVDNFQIIKEVHEDIIIEDCNRSEEPLITVVIPTFKREHSLIMALNSVLAQRKVDFSWDIIVIDNTPLDLNNQTPALKVVTQFKNNRIKYYHNEKNIGPGYNWNRAVELAQGEWICFLHDDDVLCSDALWQIGRLLKKGRRTSKKLGYLSARRVEFQDEFDSRSSEEFRRQPQEALTRFGVLICGHTGAGAPTCGTTILKKAYIEAGGINYDFGPSADAVLCYQIMKNYDVITTDCVIGGYRWNQNASLNKQTLLDFIRADDLLMQYAYQKNSKTALWGRCFGAAISWRNIWRKNNIATQYGIPINREEFAQASCFSRPSVVNQNLYLALYASYRLLRKIIGSIMFNW